MEFYRSLCCLVDVKLLTSSEYVANDGVSVYLTSVPFADTHYMMLYQTQQQPGYI